MKYFEDEAIFNREMKKLKEIIEAKGYVMESEHSYAYFMQYRSAFCDVKEWLNANGYVGKLGALGTFHGVAVYGLYDTLRITYEEMNERLIQEAELQNQMI